MDANFLTALQVLLNVPPTPRMAGVAAKCPIAAAAVDAEALESVRHLMLAADVPVSKQWAFDFPSEPKA